MFCPPSIPQTTKPLSNRELFGVLFLKYHGKGQLIHPSLVVNIIAGEVVQPIRRTAVFGKLQGAIMLGQGIGFLAGGMLGDVIEIRAPFDVAFVSFLVAALYARTFLPYISPESMSDGKKPAKGGVRGFLAPLKILFPQKLRLVDGRTRKHRGVLFLCCGIFLGVVS